MHPAAVLDRSMAGQPTAWQARQPLRVGRPSALGRSVPKRQGQRVEASPQHRAAVEDAGEAASTSGRSHLWQDVQAAAAPHVVAAVAAAALLLLPAGGAHASEAAPDGMLEFVISSIESLGPWGPAAFVATVAIAECIPLFPTQPLSLASGLLFGAQKGSLCILSGATLAALLAFLIARGIGRPLAEKIISHEMGGSTSGSMDDSSGGAGGGQEGLVQRKLGEVLAAIERGSFWQQAGAVLLLRMTPVVPFSASNYVLGLSPLPLAPYLAGTFAGMLFWSVFYASLGGASRSLLRSGVDPDVLLADLLDRASAYTREAVAVGAVLGAAAVVAVGAGVLRRRLEAREQEAGPEGRAASARSAAAPASSSGGSSAPDAARERLQRELGQRLAAGQEMVAGQASRLRDLAAAAAQRLGFAED